MELLTRQIWNSAMAVGGVVPGALIVEAFGVIGSVLFVVHRGGSVSSFLLHINPGPGTMRSAEQKDAGLSDF